MIRIKITSKTGTEQEIQKVYSVHWKQRNYKVFERYLIYFSCFTREPVSDFQ